MQSGLGVEVGLYLSQLLAAKGSGAQSSPRLISPPHRPRRAQGSLFTLRATSCPLLGRPSSRKDGDGRELSPSLCP